MPLTFKGRKIKHAMKQEYGPEGNRIFYAWRIKHRHDHIKVDPETAMWLLQKLRETAADFVESEHPRGQPENKGEFVKKETPVPVESKIVAYHGSPHDFEKFNSDKIGTGEGAQAYGHGLYFAENPTIARSYANGLAKTTRAHNTFDGIKITPGYLVKLRNSSDPDVAKFFQHYRSDILVPVQRQKAG
jgi:hypothetical protein